MNDTFTISGKGAAEAFAAWESGLLAHPTVSKNGFLSLVGRCAREE